jgi:hypothetical protein
MSLKELYHKIIETRCEINREMKRIYAPLSDDNPIKKMVRDEGKLLKEIIELGNWEEESVCTR